MREIVVSFEFVRLFVVADSPLTADSEQATNKKSGANSAAWGYFSCLPLPSNAVYRRSMMLWSHAFHCSGKVTYAFRSKRLSCWLWIS